MAGLVAEYLLNDSGDNNTIGAIVGSITGVFVGITANSSSRGFGVFPNVMSFNGSSNRVNFVGHPLSGTSGSFSIALWYNYQSTGNFKQLVAAQSVGPQIRIGFGAPEVAIFSPAARSVSGTPVVIGNWQHVIGAYDGATLKLYQNGVQTNSTEFASGCSFNGNLEFGGVNGSSVYSGLMADVRLYDYSLSDSEALLLFNMGKPSGTALNITGSHIVNGLIGTNSGTWTDGTGTNQWVRGMGLNPTNFTNIANQTGGNYTVATGDVGFNIATRFVYTNQIGITTGYSDIRIVGGTDFTTAQSANMPRLGGYAYKAGRRANIDARRVTPENITGMNSRTQDKFDDINYYV